MLNSSQTKFPHPTRKKAKIAFFIPSLRGGGAERAMLLLAGGMADRGYTVDFLTAQASGPLIAELRENVKLVDLGRKRVMSCIPALASYLRRETPAVLYSTVINANITAILANELSLTRTRLIVRESNAPQNKGGDGLRNSLLYKLAPWLYQRASAVAAVSEGVEQQLTSLNPKLARLIHVLPTPVVTEQLLQKSFEVPQHPWFASPQSPKEPIPGEPIHGEPIIVAAGRLHPQKDFGNLLRAVAIVRQTVAVRLVILGEGVERQALELLAADLGISNAVSLPGFVANPFCYMRRADLFVMSSLYEGMPNALLQAMACGTPVVSTDCESGPREALRNGALGTLVAVGDSPQLAAAIQHALALPRSQEAERFVHLHYGLDYAVQRYLNLGFLD